MNNLGPCANPDCFLGGVAPSTHQCPDCGKNIHAPCGTETEHLQHVLCPSCLKQRESPRPTTSTTTLRPAPSPPTARNAVVACQYTAQPPSILPPSSANDCQPNLHEMVNEVDRCMHLLREEWVGKIIFPIIPVPRSLHAKNPDFTLPSPLQAQDICQFLGGAHPKPRRSNLSPANRSIEIPRLAGWSDSKTCKISDLKSPVSSIF